MPLTCKHVPQVSQAWVSNFFHNGLAGLLYLLFGLLEHEEVRDMEREIDDVLLLVIGITA